MFRICWRLLKLLKNTVGYLFGMLGVPGLLLAGADSIFHPIGGFAALAFLWPPIISMYWFWSMLAVWSKDGSITWENAPKRPKRFLQILFWYSP